MESNFGVQIRQDVKDFLANILHTITENILYVETTSANTHNNVLGTVEPPPPPPPPPPPKKKKKKKKSHEMGCAALYGQIWKASFPSKVPKIGGLFTRIFPKLGCTFYGQQILI